MVMLICGGCSNGPADTTVSDLSQEKVVYTLSLTTEGGMPLSGVRVYVYNDKEQTDIAAKVAEKSGIPVVWLEKASMGGEDFCYFLEKAPGVYIRLGAGEDQPPLHNSKLLPPEEMMKAGIKYLVEFALDALKK